MADPVRVLRVIARLNMGGPTLHVSYLAKGLDERGYETTLVAGSPARGEESMSFVADELGIRIVPLDQLRRHVSPVRDTLSVGRLVRLIRKTRPHIVHTHTAKAGAVGRLAARLAGAARPPVVVHTFHGHVLSGYFDPLREQAFRQVERSLARATTRLVAVSPQVRDDLVALRVAPRDKFSVIRLGIDLEQRLRSARADRGELRRRLEIDEGRFVVGWIGRMTAIKRVGDVVQTFAQLREAGVDAVLCLVGDGPDRRVAEERVRALGLAPHIRFEGYRRDVGPYYGLFDALLLPSANEGTPVVAIEALGAGVPVVATRVGGVPDVVADGKNGFLASVGDTASMAQSLARIAGDEELRRTFAQAARQDVARRYGVNRLVDDVDELYRELLSGATRRG